jgi:hypothetical protein
MPTSTNLPLIEPACSNLIIRVLTRLLAMESRPPDSMPVAFDVRITHVIVEYMINPTVELPLCWLKVG